MSRRPPRKPPTITPMYFNNSSVLPVMKQTMFIRYLAYLYDPYLASIIKNRQVCRFSNVTGAVSLCQMFSSISNMSLFSGIHDLEST